MNENPKEELIRDLEMARDIIEESISKMPPGSFCQTHLLRTSAVMTIIIEQLKLGQEPSGMPNSRFLN